MSSISAMVVDERGDRSFVYQQNATPSPPWDVKIDYNCKFEAAWGDSDAYRSYTEEDRGR